MKTSRMQSACVYNSSSIVTSSSYQAFGRVSDREGMRMDFVSTFAILKYNRKKTVCVPLPPDLMVLIRVCSWFDAVHTHAGTVPFFVMSSLSH